MTRSPPPPEPEALRPQPGPQERWLSSPADVALYGGAAGGGKSWALLFEPLRHVSNPQFGATVFRRTYPMVTAQGGLWDESVNLYPRVGARPNLSDHRWTFPGGATVKFAHLQHEANVLDYQGAQIPLIEFDELTHFTEHQFVYMLSRNRSTCGVRPYMRATCNPDAASWVARWVDWWIDPATGYAIPERSGRLRWFVRDGDNLRWGDDKAALEKAYPGTEAKSFTFVAARLEDNKILMKKDPGYRANLMAQSRVEQERLLRGNWLVSNAVGVWPAEYFGRHLYFDRWPAPEDRALVTLAWDPSVGESEGDRFGDFSAFTVLVRDTAGRLYADALGSQRWPVEEAIDHGLELCREWDPDGFAIETNGFQKLIRPLLVRRAKELGFEPFPPVMMVNNYGKKKAVRIRRIGTYLAARTLKLKGDSTGARVLAEQLMTFPEGDHDDFPDSLEMNIRTMISLHNQKGRRPKARR